MGALTGEAEIGWEHPVTSSEVKFPGPLKIGPFLLGGEGPIHDLPLIDVTRQGVYLTFPEGARPEEDEVFRVVRPLGKSFDGVLASGRPRRIVAEVKIVSVREDPRVLVQVLRGSVIRGTAAERVMV